MKNILLLFTICFATGITGQSAIITAIFDGPLPGGSPKFAELYVISSTNFSGWALRNYNNGSASVSNSSALSSLGTLSAGSYAYVIVSGQTGDFQSYFELSTAEYNALHIVSGAAPNVNGNDAIALFDGVSNIDVFGVIGVDGTGTSWEYLDGWAYRNSLTGGSFNSSNWTFSGINATDGCTLNSLCSSVFPPNTSTGILSPLPIDLVSIKAEIIRNMTVISWQTGSEHNNQFFSIERSTDGGQSFKEIGQVEGAGDSDVPLNYRFEDDTPAFGLNYYRLRQVDFDGKFTIHKVVAVDFRPEQPGLNLFPTLVQNELTVQLPQPAEQPAQISIWNQLGQSMGAFTLPAGQPKMTLPLHNLASGPYIVQVKVGNDIVSGIFVKN